MRQRRGKIQKKRPDDNKFERFTDIFSEEDSVRENSRENKGKGTRHNATVHRQIKSRKKAEESEDSKPKKREETR